MNIVQHEIVEKPRTNWKRTCLQISISLSIIVFIFLYLPIPVIFSSIKRVSLMQWSLCFLSGLFVHILGVVKWRLQMRAVHINLGFLTVTRFYAAGLFANVFMPSNVGGDVLRSGLVIRQIGRKRDVILSGLIDRLCDIISLCSLVIFGCFFISDTIDTRGYRILIIVVVGLVGVIISGIGLLFYRPSRWWPRRLRRQAIRLRVALWRIIRNYKLALIALLLSLGLQICLILINVVLGKAIGMGLPFISWFFVWPLAKMTALVPISFGGIGVQELTLAGLSKSFAVIPALAVAQGFLWRSIIIITGICCGVIWFILDRIDKCNVKHINKNFRENVSIA